MGSRFWKILFVIFVIKSVVTCSELNSDDELKSAIDLSNLKDFSMFLKPKNGVQIPKCCPFGQSYPGIAQNYTCTNSNEIQVDSDVHSQMFELGLVPIERKLCDGVKIYIGDEANEKLWISKQGNLLHTVPNYKNSINNKYCVERNGSDIIAYYCYSTVESTFIDKIIPICRLISVPLLFIVAIIYLIVPKLRNIHGETLALYAICLSIGYLLMAYDRLSNLNLNFRMTVSGIQFFILSSFFWLLMTIVDMTYHLWSYYPNPKQFQRSILLRLTLYSFIAFGVPLLIVVAFHSNKTEMLRPRNPVTEIKTPLSLILLLNFLMLIPIYKYYTKNTLRCLIKEEVKHRAKSIVWILIVTAANWMFEMICMQWPETRESLIAFPTLDALQGVVMVCVFILMPHYKKIITEWWLEKVYSPPREQVEYDQV